MLEFIKLLFLRLTCWHKEYVFLADLSMRNTVTGLYEHSLVIDCKRCGKRKSFDFTASN